MDGHRFHSVSGFIVGWLGVLVSTLFRFLLVASEHMQMACLKRVIARDYL